MEDLIQTLETREYYNIIKDLKTKILEIKIDRPIVKAFYNYVRRTYISKELYIQEILQIFHDQNLLEIDDFYSLGKSVRLYLEFIKFFPKFESKHLIFLLDQNIYNKKIVQKLAEKGAELIPEFLDRYCRKSGLDYDFLLRETKLSEDNICNLLKKHSIPSILTKMKEYEIKVTPKMIDIIIKDPGCKYNKQTDGITFLLENKSGVSQDNFHDICLYGSDETIDLCLDYDFIPVSEDLDNILKNPRTNKEMLIGLILNRFDISLNKDQTKKCLDKGLYLKQYEINQDNLEEFFKNFKLSKFKKKIKSLKLNTECLENACLLGCNITTIRNLVEKYHINPNEKCLENVCSHGDRKMTEYLTSFDLEVTRQCLINLVLSCDRSACYCVGKLLKSQNEQKVEINVDDIEGVENL